MSAPRDERLDPETLAALMEGRLSDDERARVMAALAASEADLEVLGDAAAVVEALEGSASTASPPGRIRWRVWLPLAALVAGVSLIPVLRGPPRADFADLRLALARVEPVPSPLALPPVAGRDAVRSGAPDALLDSLGATARSFRRGAAFARLAVVVPDARRAGADAAALEALLASSAGGAARPAVEAWYPAGAADEGAWTAAAEALAAVEGTPAAFRLGLEVETASLLVAEGDVGAAADLVAGVAASLDGLDTATRAALDDEFARLDAAFRSPDADPAALAAALDAFAARIASYRSGDTSSP